MDRAGERGGDQARPRAIDDWAIAQVGHHEIEVPTKYRYYQGYLQAKHRKIAVMYCEDETDWRNEIKLEEAEFLDDARYTGGTGGCGGVDVHIAKAWFFEPPTPQSWKNVLTFQEQAVLVAAAGSGNCITFQERTVCTPRVGTADSTQVCATVTTTCTCQCSCNCDCNCGDSGGGYPSSGGGSGGSSNCNCSCTCHANSIISFG